VRLDTANKKPGNKKSPKRLTRAGLGSKKWSKAGRRSEIMLTTVAGRTGLFIAFDIVVAFG
jgi:hypothetical protein